MAVDFLLCFRGCGSWCNRKAGFVRIGPRYLCKASLQLKTLLVQEVNRALYVYLEFNVFKNPG